MIQACPSMQSSLKENSQQAVKLIGNCFLCVVQFQLIPCCRSLYALTMPFPFAKSLKDSHLMANTREEGKNNKKRRFGYERRRKKFGDEH